MRKPEEILAYRPLKAILESKPRALWSVGPNDSVAAAVKLMADKDIGCVVVLDDSGVLVGIVSERDCARHVLAGKPAGQTPVAEIMTRDVIAVDVGQNFAECLRLMHRHAIRHLPIIEAGKPSTVISVRDLLAEAVSHHAKIIAELERERLTVFTSMA